MKTSVFSLLASVCGTMLLTSCVTKSVTFDFDQNNQITAITESTKLNVDPGSQDTPVNSYQGIRIGDYRKQVFSALGSPDLIVENYMWYDQQAKKWVIRTKRTTDSWYYENGTYFFFIPIH